MARFYGRMKGNRGEATRMGSAPSGFSAHISGWNIGAAVRCSADGGLDVVTVTATSRQIDLSKHLWT